MDERAHLRGLIARAGITLSDPELEAVLPGWRQARAALDALRRAIDEQTPPMLDVATGRRASTYHRVAPPPAAAPEDAGSPVPPGSTDGLGLAGLDISALAPLLRSRQVSPVELTEAYLRRIERLDGTVGSFLTVTYDRALADAKRAEGEIARGEYRGPLHGVPFGLKDLLDTAGIRTTANSPALADRVPSADAEVTRRLVAAGIVLLGKQRMHEFAIGAVFAEHPLGIARNPWSLDRSPGGSSSGSGAGLAARLCAGAIGSDSGGSIRIPAAHCGITGLKPTFGRVSVRGVIPLAWSLDHVGPMARSVADATLILQAIAGHDPLDSGSVDAPVPDYTAALGQSIRGLRIGAPLSLVEQQTASYPDVWNAYRAALDVLASLGAEVVEVSLRYAEHAAVCMQAIIGVEAAAYHEARLAAHYDRLGTGFRRRMLLGVLLSALDYVQALRARALVTEQLDRTLQQVDLIATPTTPHPAQTFEEMRQPGGALHAFTGIYNLSGLPALSLPCGFDSRGLPIGLMLAGRCFDEPTVLRVGDAYQRATDWHRRVPPLAIAGQAQA